MCITENDTNKDAIRLTRLPKHTFAKSAVPAMVPRSAKVERDLAILLGSNISDPVSAAQID